MSVVEEGFKVVFTGDAASLEKSGVGASSVLDRVNKSALQAGKALDKTHKSQQTATQSLINLSRVAQDAPFGFIGIANNLNPLLESFQRLRKESGSVGASLKALGGEMLGAGGIGLALGVVSSLLVVFGDKLFGAGKKAEETKKPLNEVKESLEGIAAASAATSVAGVEKFALALTSSTISLSQRRAALDEYNQSAAKSNQLQESDLSNIDKVNGAINRQIELLKTRALIKGAEDQLAASFKTIFNAQFKINNALDKANPTIKDAYELFKGANAESKDFITGLKFDKQLQATKQLGFNFFRLREGAKGAAEQVEPLIKFIDKLLNRAEGQGGFFDTSKQDDEDAKNAADAAKKRLDALKKAKEEELKLYQQRQLEIKQFLAQPIQDGNDEFRDMMRRSIIDIKIPDKLTQLKVPVQIIPEVLKNTDTTGLVNKGLKDQLAEELSKTINEAILSASKQISVQGFTSIGEAIGAALSGGDIGGAFKAFAASIGDALQAMGKQIIGIGVAALLAKQALSKLFANPAIAIVAGTALVAAGAALKNALSGGIKGFASGGLAFGPTLGLVGEGRGTNRSNPEIIAPLNKLSQFLGGGNDTPGNGVLRIRGNDLILATSRNARRQGRVH